MNVQEMIDQLLKIEDKSRVIMFIGHDNDDYVSSIKEGEYDDEPVVLLYNC
jgi:hypothetical protein